MQRACVRVVALGGTIAMTGSAGEGVTPTLDADDLVAAVPGLDRIATIEAESFRQLPGGHLGLEDLVALAHHLERAIADGCDGVVVTQGTDTIEETAFALDLLTATPTPIVVTGAMRNPAQPGADGPANLRNAVRIAADPAAGGLGVLVTLDDRIHAARFVRKAHTSRPSAFDSETVGPIGWISEDRVRIPLRPRERVHVRLAAGTPLPRVALLTASLGEDLTDTFDASAYGGVVIEGMGAGHVRPATADALEDLSARIPVVLTSRTGAGEVYRATYGFVGSERDLFARGLLHGGALDGLKARLLLAFALAAGWDRDTIEAGFATLCA